MSKWEYDRIESPKRTEKPIGEIIEDWDKISSGCLICDALRTELKLARTQVRCDLITGEPGHQKLLCDKLQDKLEAANEKIIDCEAARMSDAFTVSETQRELAIKDRMIEAMARRVNYNANHKSARRIREIMDDFRAQAEREEKGGKR